MTCTPSHDMGMSRHVRCMTCLRLWENGACRTKRSPERGPCAHVGRVHASQGSANEWCASGDVSGVDALWTVSGMVERRYLGAVQLRTYDECTRPEGSTNEWCGLMTISGVGTTYASGAARG